MRLSITRAAQADIDEAWVYLAIENGINYANRVRDSLVKTFFLLQRALYAGRNREFDMASGLRSISSSKHVVFYRVEFETLRIVCVLHGSRNIKAVFSDE